MTNTSECPVDQVSALVHAGLCLTPAAKGDAVLIASPPDISREQVQDALDTLRRNGTIHDYSHALDCDSRGEPISLFCVIRPTAQQTAGCTEPLRRGLPTGAA